MITNAKGFLKQPYTLIQTSSRNDNVLDEDYLPQDKKSIRRKGEFYCRIYEQIPLNPSHTNYIFLKSLIFDNFSPLNFNPQIHYIEYYKNDTLIRSSRADGQQKMSNADSAFQFVSKLMGTGANSQLKYFRYDRSIDKVVIDLKEDEKLIISEETKELLGFRQTEFSPKTISYNDFQVDLYKSMRPMILTCSISQPACLGLNLTNILAYLDCKDLAPHHNKNTLMVFDFSQDANPYWSQIVTQNIPHFLKFSIVDQKNNPIQFHSNSDISMLFVIRTSPLSLI